MVYVRYFSAFSEKSINTNTTRKRAFKKTGLILTFLIELITIKRDV